MPFIAREGCRLHWSETGAGSPLLLIMGATYSSKMWYPAVPALSTRHRVLLFDNRGTGQSTATPVASIQDMAADARSVMDAAGVETAHVFGVSLGGVVALELALQSPERMRSLVLGCTGILTADKPRAPRSMNLLFRVPRPLLRAMAGTAGYGPACPPDRIEQDRQVLRAEHTVRQGLVAQQDALRAYAVTREAVAGLTVPALVQHGTADRLVKPQWGEELAATLPNSRYLSYEGAGHNYLVAAGDTANQDVLAFLDEVDARATLSTPQG